MTTTFTPLTIRYPDNFDGDDNQFLLHDSIRFRLVNDYNPGDTSITLAGATDAFTILPANGIVTLTDQCSDLDSRAISFRYHKDATTSMLIWVELMDGFPDVAKSQQVTDVTMNVMAEHHNQLKDTLIAIEKFIGVKGRIDSQPLSENATLEGRINYLRSIVLSPKAYFTASPTMGLAPLTVTFTDGSFRLGTDGTAGDITYIWNFGDGTQQTIVVPAADIVSSSPVTVTKGSGSLSAYSAGKYNVTLTVQNKFGEDTIEIPQMIWARNSAPEEAHILFQPISGQIGTSYTADSHLSGYDSPPLRTAVNTLVSIVIPQGYQDPTRPAYDYAGELLPVTDPITSFTWGLTDDLSHATGPSTKASYSIGGLYDVKVRADTQNGCYRITTDANAIDVVEQDNLWLFLFQPGSATLVNSYEFSLLGETFKLAGPSTLTITRDNSFLTGLPNETQQKQEFSRNVGFTASSTTASGDQGDSLLYYASGRSAAASSSTEQVTFTSFNGFAQTFVTTLPALQRPWNWVSLNSTSNAYFLFGSTGTTPVAGTSPTNPQVDSYNLASYTVSSSIWDTTDFYSGADELLTNAGFSPSAQDFANFSVYRSTWQTSAGYIMRNAGVGPFFRLQSFYGTQGTVAAPVTAIAKLTDMPGSTRPEGQITGLSSGVYFFGNSGQIAAYNPSTLTWQTGGPGTSSASFQSLQDQTVSNYDSLSQTLLIASDNDKRAYLSFDYSVNTFIEFSATNTSFSSLPARPLGTQFAMGLY